MIIAVLATYEVPLSTIKYHTEVTEVETQLGWPHFRRKSQNVSNDIKNNLKKYHSSSFPRSGWEFKLLEKSDGNSTAANFLETHFAYWRTSRSGNELSANGSEHLVNSFYAYTINNP